MADIRYEHHGAVRLITIDRPQKMNSLDFAANDELVARWLLADQPGPLEDAYPALRAVLLRSAGVPEARIGAVPDPAAGSEFPELRA